MSEDKNVPQENTNLDAEEQKPVEDNSPVEPEKVTEPVEEPSKAPTIPLSKFNEEREKAAQKAREEAKAEFEKEMTQMKQDYEARLAQNQSTSGVEDRISKWAEENGYDKAAASSLVDVIKSSIELPDTSKYDKLLEAQQRQEWKEYVDKEFQNIVPEIQKDFPSASPQHLMEAKSKLEELAQSPRYQGYHLQDIYKINKQEFEYKDGHSAEGSTGRNTEMVDFESMTDEDEIALADKDPETYKKFINWQRGRASKYIN